MAVGISSSLTLLASRAAAEAPEPPEQGAPPGVELFVDLQAADVRIDGTTVHDSCRAPCVLRVPAGYYTVSTPEVGSKEIVVDRRTHLGLSRGSPTGKAVSTGLLVTGVLIVATAVIVPLLLCKTPERETDQYGRVYVPPDPCNDLPTSFKIGWLAGAGVGLTVGLVGAIGLAAAGPRFTLSF